MLDRETADTLQRGTAADAIATAAALALSAARAEAQAPAGSPPRVPPRSNVISGAEHRAALLAALSDISQVVARTLGPHGAPVLVRHPAGSHFATKDGYQVLKHMLYVQETACMVLDHCRSVSRAVVRRVGDGSTTAVVMAEALARTFHESGALGDYPPGAVKAAMDATADALGATIDKHARTPTAASIAQVATIAANNDPEIGGFVAALVASGSSVLVEAGQPGDETHVREAAGYRIHRGMADEAFANEAAGIEGAAPAVCRLKNAGVLIWAGPMGVQDFILTAMEAGNHFFLSGRPFVLVAQEYVPEVVKMAADFRRRSGNNVPLLLVDHAMASRRALSKLGDLAAAIGAVAVDPAAAPRAQKAGEMDPAELQELIAKCGDSASVVATMGETSFETGKAALPAAVERARELRDSARRVGEADNSESMADEIAELLLRASQLEGSTKTIVCGGATEAERVELKDRIEDAVLAAQAATASGVVEGMGMTCARALSDFEASEFLAEYVRDRILEATRLPAAAAAQLARVAVDATGAAYAEAFRSVVKNSGADPSEVFSACISEGKAWDAMTGLFHDPAGTPVLNPAATDKEVLRGAMGIASILTSSSQTLLIRPRVGGGQD